MEFRVAWYLGFGWLSILTIVISGIGINLFKAPVSWLLYIPFLVTAIYMTIRFRVFSMHPWRRVHARVMMSFSPLAQQEYELARKEGREYDIRVPCQQLLKAIFGQADSEVAKLLTDDGRKLYYKGLAEEYPDIFLKSFTSIDPDTVFAKINQDIDSSELGPDILIAKDIELRYSRKEAATYLQSLMLGTVR